MPIKNKTADRIAICESLSDVCKHIRQVRREMENREAFIRISAEPKETVEEVNWRQTTTTREVEAIQIEETTEGVTGATISNLTYQSEERLQQHMQ